VEEGHVEELQRLDDVKWKVVGQLRRSRKRVFQKLHNRVMHAMAVKQALYDDFIIRSAQDEEVASRFYYGTLKTYEQVARKVLTENQCLCLFGVKTQAITSRKYLTSNISIYQRQNRPQHIQIHVGHTTHPSTPQHATTHPHTPQYTPTHDLAHQSTPRSTTSAQQNTPPIPPNHHPAHTIHPRYSIHLLRQRPS
jgi:hypothetical protein